MTEEKVQMPLGLKIIYVLMVINTVFAWIVAILVIAARPFLTEFISDLGIFKGVSSNQIFLVINSFGFGLFAEGILSFFIYRGLKKRQSWAKNLLNILSWLGLFGSLLSLLFAARLQDILQGIGDAAINAAFAFYLTFSRRVKKFFARREAFVI